MRRRYRWLIAALITAVVLPIVAVVAVLLWLDPNDLRAGAESSARKQLGLPLTLHGDLHWSWWPLFAINAGAGEIAGADDAPLLSWKQLQLGARWREMLNQQYVIERISVDGLIVQLRRDTAGRGNWQSLFNREAGNSSLHIRQLRVTEGAVSFSDQASGRKWSASKLNASLELAVDAASTLTLTQPQLTATLSGSGQTTNGVPVSAQVDRMVYSAAAGTIEMPAVQLRVANLDAVVRLSEPLKLAPLTGAGKLELSSDSVRSTLRAFGVSLPPMRDAKTLGAARASTQMRVANESMAFSELKIVMDETSIQGTASYPLKADGETTVDLRGDTLNADRYLRPADQPGEPFELPVKFLRALKLRGSLTLDGLTVRGVTARDTRIRFED